MPGNWLGKNQPCGCATPVVIWGGGSTGNATFADVVIIWARNLDTKKVNAFVVKKGTPGFSTTKIENKIALRYAAEAAQPFACRFAPGAVRRVPSAPGRASPVSSH